jgi:hypothetical protein
MNKRPLFLAAAWRRTLEQCPRSRSRQKQWSFGHMVWGGRHEGTSAKRDGGTFLRLEERAECADGRREAERGGPSYEWVGCTIWLGMKWGEEGCTGRRGTEKLHVTKKSGNDRQGEQRRGLKQEG